MALTRWPALLAASELAEEPSAFELGVRSFTGSAQLGVRAVGLLAGLGLVASLVRGEDDAVLGAFDNPCRPA